MRELPVSRSWKFVTRWTPIAASLFWMGLPVAGQERTTSLSATQVVCDQNRLARLLDRMELILPDGPVAGFSGIPTLFVSESQGGVLYRGSEVRNESGSHFPPIPSALARRRPESDCFDTRERMLGYQLSVQPEQFLLNPDRPPLDQFLLARVEPQTNPTSIRCFLEDDHHLRLGTGPERQPFASVLEINNIIAIPAGRESQGAMPSASGASRNLRAAGLVARCHDLLTEWDRRTFALLERMLRPYTTFIADESLFYHDQEVAIYRGADPRTYRVDAYSIGKDTATGRGVAVGRSSYELVIGWDEAGRWTTGSIRLLPVCAVGQTQDCSTYAGPAWIFLYPPILPDFGLRGVPSNAVFVGRGLTGLAESAPVDWADLLAETVWNRGADRD